MKLKFTKIQNAILLINILFTTIFTSPTTALKANNMGNVFNINELEAIGRIKVDEALRTELLNSFNCVHFQSGDDIFKNFFDILFFLIMDKVIGNEHNIFRAHIDLSKNLLHENQVYQGLLEMFNFILMQDVAPVTLNQFLPDLMVFLSDEANFGELVSSMKQLDQLYTYSSNLSDLNNCPIQ